MAMLHRVSLAKYETGAVEPGALALSRIADALNVSTDELLCRTEKTPPFVPIMKNAMPIVGEIACGEKITAEQNIDGYLDTPDGVNADFALRCKGDSMTPTFNNGDYVLIRQQPEVENGQIAAVGVNGEATLKRVYVQQGGILCISDNPQFAPMFFTAEDAPVIYDLAVGYVRML
jgi:repressor LexA